MGKQFNDSSGKALEFGAQSSQDQSFIEWLLSVPEDQALRLLQVHVTALGDAEYNAFDANLAMLIAAARQSPLRAQDAGDLGGGGRGERNDQCLAHLSAQAQWGPDPQPMSVNQPGARRLHALQGLRRHALRLRPLSA